MHHPIRSPETPLGFVSAAALAALAAGASLWSASPAGAATQGASEALPQPAMERGRALFHDTGCSQCHTLADAGATGAYGPSLDGNPELTRALALDRLTNGRGDMPSFAGILSNEELAQLAAYVAAAAQHDEAS